jgi:hypothetical protein
VRRSSASPRHRRALREAAGRVGRELNRIILLPPNEGLAQQHLREFEKAGIEAEIFNKDGRGLFAGQAVEILEVTKLREEMGEKTVAVDAFEGNNLVLVDEGHRGASAGGDDGQAVKGSKPLTDLCARSTLFEYSYRWFYGDGFGKDYHILNLEDDSNEEWMKSYLTACLLAFLQQQRLFREREAAFRPFNLERPLWIFVGGSVTATLAARDASDREVPNLGKLHATRRVARTILVGSAPTVAAAHHGLEDRRVKLGCVMPSESAAVFGDALRRLVSAATYLYQDPPLA